MVCCDGNRIDNGDDHDPGLNNSSADIRFVSVLCSFSSVNNHLKILIDYYKLMKQFL